MKKNHQKGFISIGIIIAILAIMALAGGATYIAKKKVPASNEIKINEPQPSADMNANNPSGSNSNQNNVPATNTANNSGNIQPPALQGNVFTNSNGNYSFKYPSVWNVAINQYNSKNSLFGPNANSGSGLGGVEISANYSSIDMYLNNFDAQFTNKTSVVVDGVSGIRTEYIGTPVSGVMVVLLKDGKIYNIFVNSKKSDDIAHLDQIVSSFKFLSIQ